MKPCGTPCPACTMISPGGGRSSDYAFLLRARDGTVTVAYDRHVEGLFARADWLRWFAEAGLTAHSSLDPWGREIFVATRRGPDAGGGEARCALQ